MKARNYRRPEGMTYARHEYIHGAPPSRITKYTAGDYTHELLLVPETDLQIRDVSIEAARITANKALTEKLNDRFYLKIQHT
jgi:ribosomal protein L16/L10AE